MYNKKDNKSVQAFFGGISAEICANVLRSPFEIMKQNLQVGNDKNLTDVAKRLYAMKGLRGFYIGFGSLLGREIPFSCIQMPIYELVKGLFITEKKKYMKKWETLLSGFVAGSTAAVVTNPIDVVKTNIMTQKTQIYDGFFHCARDLYNKNGIMVFTKGMGYRYITIGSMSVFFFLGYETFMEFINDKF